MSREPDLFDYQPPARYPEAPGFKEATTSREAADSMAELSSLLQERVLASLRDLPGTADEVAARLNETVLAVRPRLSELRKLAKITPRGDRRKNVSGRSAIVWKVT